MRRASPLSRPASKDQAIAQQPNRLIPKNTASADKNNRRPSPKPIRRSPRTPLQEIVPAGNQRKIIPRGSDLETKLSNAQEELRKIKLQLDCAEAATLDVQLELAATKISAVDKQPSPELATAEAEIESLKKELEETEARAGAATVRADVAAHRLSQSRDELAVAAAEIDQLQSENERLKKQLAETESRAATAEARADVAAHQVATAELRANQLQEQLQAVEWARAELETEMSKTSAQAEQWRKAAEAAAAVLTPTDDKCRLPAELSSLWSPPLATVDPDTVRSERRVSGIRSLSDIWKKKGPQKSS